MAISAAESYAAAMIFARQDHIDAPHTIPQLPAWITSARVETIEDASFLAGAALSHLHLVLRREEVPHAVLRDRLALRAAEVCVVFSGRSERAAELRDAVHLLRQGDLPGPAGEVLVAWRSAVERPISVKGLGQALPTLQSDQIAMWLDAGKGVPVTRAAMVLETVLAQAPRAEVQALVLADSALALAHGWDHVVPLLALGLKRADLRKRRCGPLRILRGEWYTSPQLRPSSGRKAPGQLSKYF